MIHSAHVLLVLPALTAFSHCFSPYFLYLCVCGVVSSLVKSHLASVTARSPFFTSYPIISFIHCFLVPFFARPFFTHSSLFHALPCLPVLFPCSLRFVDFLSCHFRFSVFPSLLCQSILSLFHLLATVVPYKCYNNSRNTTTSCELKTSPTPNSNPSSILSHALALLIGPYMVQTSTTFAQLYDEV